MIYRVLPEKRHVGCFDDLRLVVLPVISRVLSVLLMHGRGLLKTARDGG